MQLDCHWKSAPKNIAFPPALPELDVHNIKEYWKGIPTPIWSPHFIAQLYHFSSWDLIETWLRTYYSQYAIVILSFFIKSMQVIFLLDSGEGCSTCLNPAIPAHINLAFTVLVSAFLEMLLWKGRIRCTDSTALFYTRTKGPTKSTACAQGHGSREYGRRLVWCRAVCTEPANLSNQTLLTPCFCAFDFRLGILEAMPQFKRCPEAELPLVRDRTLFFALSAYATQRKACKHCPRLERDRRTNVQCTSHLQYLPQCPLLARWYQLIQFCSTTDGQLWPSCLA